MRTNYVHSSNSSKMFGNKIGVGKNGSLLHIKNQDEKHNLLLIEVEKQKKINEIIKVTPDGELYLKGQKYYNSLDDKNNDIGIVLGQWKIIPKEDKLLIQKQINGEWITRQQFD